jgi:hypothetical protein
VEELRQCGTAVGAGVAARLAMWGPWCCVVALGFGK